MLNGINSVLQSTKFDHISNALAVTDWELSYKRADRATPKYIGCFIMNISICKSMLSIHTYIWFIVCIFFISFAIDVWVGWIIFWFIVECMNVRLKEVSVKGIVREGNCLWMEVSAEEMFSWGDLTVNWGVRWRKLLVKRVVRERRCPLKRVESERSCPWWMVPA